MIDDTAPDAGERLGRKLAALAATLTPDEQRVFHDVVHLAGSGEADEVDLGSAPSVALFHVHDGMHGGIHGGEHGASGTHPTTEQPS